MSSCVSGLYCPYFVSIQYSSFPFTITQCPVTVMLSLCLSAYTLGLPVIKLNFSVFVFLPTHTHDTNYRLLSIFLYKTLYVGRMHV